MSDALYDQAIKDHARAAVGNGRLEDPHGSATVDNPVCGDRVTVDLKLRDGVVEAMAHRVRGCMLCEAAASVLASKAPGLGPAQLRAAARAFSDMIREDDDPPPSWPELEAFTPVKAVRSRHECVLLPFEAVDRALLDAGA